MGVNLMRTRLVAYAVSAFYGGMAGGLLAPPVLHHAGWLHDLRDDQGARDDRGRRHGQHLRRAVRRGALTFGNELLRFSQFFQEIGFGLLLLVSIILMPEGVASPGARCARGRRGMRPMEGILDVQGVSKRFGGLAALEDVSFRVGQGEIHALIGPNGAGKTTVLNLLTRIYRPTAGRHDGGRDLAKDGRTTSSGAASPARSSTSSCFPASACSTTSRSARSPGAAGRRCLGPRSPRRQSQPPRGDARRPRCSSGSAWRISPTARRGRSPAGRPGWSASPARSPPDRSSYCSTSSSPGSTARRPRSRPHRAQPARRGRHHRLVVEHDMRFVMSVSDRITVLNFGRRIASGTRARCRTTRR